MKSRNAAAPMATDDQWPTVEDYRQARIACDPQRSAFEQIIAEFSVCLLAPTVEAGEQLIAEARATREEPQ